MATVAHTIVDNTRWLAEAEDGRWLWEGLGPLRYEEFLSGLPIFEKCWAPLCLATTEVSSCHNRHLVSPQRTSFLAAADTPRGKRGCPQSRIPNPIGDCENGQTNGLVTNHIQGSLPRPDFPAPILFLLRLEDCDCDYKK